MHLGAEQQPPTAPATEAAHPAFPASRAVFRGCFSPASSGRHRLAAAANRVPDEHLALALVQALMLESDPAVIQIWFWSLQSHLGPPVLNE
ncbi:hypothetical protein NDU88_001730 [Pleurodeles waltl]|uniref:Uncharacterized protein n=1 Tax=Pleurodeles waltl TaxID=8319 RepID=A0AAV7VYH2_PLEWA|nr:hypothetical protein NDU88_001730 [Pleurodeles waltl]